MAEHNCQFGGAITPGEKDMMKEPFVSICVPNYNYGRYIGETIKSILDQTYTNFELIISDNTSTDNSMDVINSFNDPRMRVYQNDTNIGMLANTKKCYEYAKGDYIAIFCSDDIYPKRIIELEVKGLSAFDYVGAAAISHTSELAEYRKQENNNVKEIKTYNQLSFLKYLFSGYTLSSSLMLKRDCYEQIPFSQSPFLFAADQDYILRIAAKYGLALIEDLKMYKLYKSGDIHVGSQKALIAEYPLLKETAKNIYMASPHKDELETYYTFFIATQDRSICRRSLLIGDYKTAKNHLVLYMQKKLGIARDEHITNWIKSIDDAPL